MKYVFKFERSRTVSERAYVAIDAPSLAAAKERVREGVNDVLEYERVAGDTSSVEEPRLVGTGEDACKGYGRNVPCIGHLKPEGQQDKYNTLPDNVLKGVEFVRPVRTSYRHLTCRAITVMSTKIAETYAAKPDYYTATYCVRCDAHYPVGENGQFVWMDGTKVGT